jgi:hypothetical protein
MGGAAARGLGAWPRAPSFTSTTKKENSRKKQFHMTATANALSAPTRNLWQAYR